ncbi:hypothetical protein L1887_51905 [Cichorium endivia]|nr:hypothetical protein L1887_51905 [Cichorium endivia]
MPARSDILNSKIPLSPHHTTGLNSCLNAERGRKLSGKNTAICSTAVQPAWQPAKQWARSWGWSERWSSRVRASLRAARAGLSPVARCPKGPFFASRLAPAAGCGGLFFREEGIGVWTVAPQSAALLVFRESCHSLSRFHRRYTLTFPPALPTRSPPHSLAITPNNKSARTATDNLTYSRCVEKLLSAQQPAAAQKAISIVSIE